jgi:hypothetical protein
MFPMLINGFRIDEDIINVNNGKMAKGIKNVVHDPLEFTRGILKSKRHNISFIMSKGSGKGCLIPILFSNLDLPKSRFHIKLREEEGFTKAVD